MDLNSLALNTERDAVWHETESTHQALLRELAQDPCEDCPSKEVQSADTGKFGCTHCLTDVDYGSD